MTRILGIDPGSQRTGVGVIDVDAAGRCSYVHCEALVLLDAEDFPARLGLLCDGLEAQVQHMVRLLLNLAEARLQADAADALAVALTHAHMSATAARTGASVALLRRR